MPPFPFIGYRKSWLLEDLKKRGVPHKYRESICVGVQTEMDAHYDFVIESKVEILFALLKAMEENNPQKKLNIEAKK